MEIKKVIMSNGNEYSLVWYENSNVEYVLEDSLKMIDIEKGEWVELKRKFISEVISFGKLSTHVHPKAKLLINEQYGEEVFLE